MVVSEDGEPGVDPRYAAAQVALGEGDIERAVTEGSDDVTFEVHPGAGHAFDNPSPMFHHAEASATAWQQTTQWLAGHLPVS